MTWHQCPTVASLNHVMQLTYRIIPMQSTKFAWWRHQMETFFALLAICVGNSPVTGEFPAQRSVTQSFDVFFDLPLNKRLSKQSWGWWFETPWCSLWRHRNGEKSGEWAIVWVHSLSTDSCPFRKSVRWQVLLNWLRADRIWQCRMQNAILFRPQCVKCLDDETSPLTTGVCHFFACIFLLSHTEKAILPVFLKKVKVITSPNVI